MVIDSSEGVATLDSPEKNGHDHGDDHDHGDEHGHAHGEFDPHIWLDPLRAVQQVENIRDGLVEADPSCAEGYRRNADAYTAQLRKLNGEIEATLQPFNGKTFIVFHDFAQYFAERYGLRSEFLVDVPELNPTPADLQRVSNAVKRSQVQALLTEPQEGERSLYRTLANDLGVEISVFDPLGTGSEEDSRDPSTYLRVMRSNAENLRQAFGG
jgi:zinc/manganese transport system substrate-binding protein